MCARYGADGEEGRAISEWEVAEAHLPQACSVLSSATPELPPGHRPHSPLWLPPSLRPAPFPPCFAQTPHLRASLCTPSPSRPRPFPRHNLIPTPSPTEPRSSLSCLPAEPSGLCPPPGLRPGPRRSDPRIPSLGPGPLLTPQTSAPETEPERYTGTGNPPTALRPAVATATAAATPRSPPRDRGGPGQRPAQPQ